MLTRSWAALGAFVDGLWPLLRPILIVPGSSCILGPLLEVLGLDRGDTKDVKDAGGGMDRIALRAQIQIRTKDMRNFGFDVQAVPNLAAGKTHQDDKPRRLLVELFACESTAWMPSSFEKRSYSPGRVCTDTRLGHCRCSESGSGWSICISSGAGPMPSQPDC